MKTAEPIDLLLVFAPDFVFFAAHCGFVFFAELGSVRFGFYGWEWGWG
jgi:hypothetical protein